MTVIKRLFLAFFALNLAATAVNAMGICFGGYPGGEFLHNFPPLNPLRFTSHQKNSLKRSFDTLAKLLSFLGSAFLAIYKSEINEGKNNPQIPNPSLLWKWQQHLWTILCFLFKVCLWSGRIYTAKILFANQVWSEAKFSEKQKR